MIYCKKCGSEQPDDSAFCTSCGENLKQTIDVIKEQTPTVVVDEQVNNAETTKKNASEPQKSFDALNWLKSNFMPLYVILGVVSIVLLQFATMTSLSAFGFAVTLAVFAILCSIVFCAAGTINFFTVKGKHSACQTICFAIGIIGFIYVLVTSIVVLKSASDLIDTMNAFVLALTGARR